MVREKINFLPLGSIVIINGGYRKYMIMARGVAVNVNGKDNYFDYGACLYPEGMIGDKVIYFQHSDVNKIVHEGYSDDDDIVMVENINTAFYNMKLTHADAQKVKEEINSNKELKKMSNTANGKIIFYEDQVFDKMLDHSVKLPKLKVKISSQSEE